MIVDLRWHTVLWEVLTRTWPMFAAFALLQVVVLQRLGHSKRLAFLLPAVASGLGVSSMIATSLYTLPLTEAIAQYLAAHFWMLGVAASLGGFLPITVAWIIGPRLWGRYGPTPAA